MLIKRECVGVRRTCRMHRASAHNTRCGLVSITHFVRLSGCIGIITPLLSWPLAFTNKTDEVFPCLAMVAGAMPPRKPSAQKISMKAVAVTFPKNEPAVAVPHNRVSDFLSPLSPT